jgi:ABC-type multidrug transport system fused ATPase/permease subunit
VQKALDALLQQQGEMTTVIIAHRLRTVYSADKIVVLEHGRVVEEGPHEELIRITNGVYRSMVERACDTGMLPEC